MKNIKRVLALASVVALLAGCATDRNTGGMGNETEVGAGAGASEPPPSSRNPMGDNGSQGSGNPLGLGGSGIDRVHNY
jgi:hypothetical protein